MSTERDPAFKEVIDRTQERQKKDDALIKEYERNQSLYATRQAVFDAAHTIMDATDVYESDARIEKWAVVIAAHKLNGNDKIPKPSKIRFALSEDDLTKSKQLSDRIVLGITAGESIALQQEKEHAAAVMADTPDIQNKIIEEARNIYESGGFVKYALDTYAKVWYRDQHIFRWMLCVFGNNFVKNTTEGLHLYICGPSGLGKSESVKVFLSTIPEEYVITGSFSKRSILYTGDTPEGTLIFQDDHVPTDDEAEIIRAILSSWSTGFTHHTVERINNENVRTEKHIPKRLTKILTNADAISRSNSNGQDESRYVCIEFSRTKDEMKEIINFDKELPDISHEIQVIKAIWRIIASSQREVTIPFTIKVKDEGLFKIREFKRFKTLLKTIALLDNRTTTTEEDFKTAMTLWNYIVIMLDNESAGAKKPEEQVLQTMIELAAADPLKEFYLSDLVKSLQSMKAPNIYRHLRGRDGNFENPTGGLLTMIPGISIKETYNRSSGVKDRIISLPAKLTGKIKMDIYYIDCFSESG